jgi:hypothetical protein
MKKVGHHYQIHKQKTKPEKLNKGGIGEWYWDAEANFDSLSISISLYFQIVNSGTNSNIKNPSPSMEIQSSKKTKTKIQPKKHQKGEKIYIHVYVILFLLLLWRQEKLNWDFDHNQERSHDRTKEERKTGISPLSFHLSRIAIVSPADEHGDAAPHDVEPCPLLLHKPSALSCERTPSVWGTLHERSGRGAASGWPFFLW